MIPWINLGNKQSNLLISVTLAGNVKGHFQHDMAKLTFHLGEMIPASVGYQVNILQFDIALYANSNAVPKSIFCGNEIEY
jgi:hypothetical protein